MLGALALNPAIPISRFNKPELLECCLKLAFVSKEQQLREQGKGEICLFFTNNVAFTTQIS